MALAFRDDESLRVVLTSGLCPPEVQARGARVGRDERGAVILAPDQPLPAAAAAALRQAGVVFDAKLPEGSRAVRCWAEAIALDRVPVAEIPALVLVTTPGTGGVIELAAELLRLGCERQELLVGPAGGVVRVTDPPTYTMMRAIDRDAGLRAYAPDPPGQDAVYTELGYRHPLAGRLRADPGHLLLVSPEGWRSIADEGWRGLESALELAIPADRIELATGPLAERRRVELRLAPGRREAPSLWVIRTGGIAAIDRMLAYLPEEVVGRLTFAAGTPTAAGLGPLIVRARTSRHPPPDLSLDAEVYAPLAHLPDVYAPAGAIVEPPLRRERLRSILGVEPGQVAWLAPLGSQGDAVRGPFRVERITDAAFAPLAEWAEYVIHASAGELVPWMRATTFDFAPFVSTGLEWAQAPVQGPSDAAQDPRARTRPQRRRARRRCASRRSPSTPSWSRSRTRSWRWTPRPTRRSGCSCSSSSATPTAGCAAAATPGCASRARCGSSRARRPTRGSMRGSPPSSERTCRSPRRSTGRSR
jgi:cellulose synthase operon protein C